MEDRINVNGVWYVRETTEPSNIDEKIKSIIERELVPYEACIFEDTDFSFEAKVIYGSDGNLALDFLSIEYLNKKTGNRDFWDGIAWFKGVLEGSQESLEQIEEELSKEEINYFRAFLSVLNDKGWL